MSNFIDIENFKKWVIEKDLENETIKGFWENFNSWKEECPEEYKETFEEGFELEKLSTYIKSVSFTFTNWPDDDYNHIVIRLSFEYDETVVGEYRMIFEYETGDIFDDVFHIY